MQTNDLPATATVADASRPLSVTFDRDDDDEAFENQNSNTVLYYTQYSVFVCADINSGRVRFDVDAAHGVLASIADVQGKGAGLAELAPASL